MIALIQRVAEARVDVAGATIGAIGAGLLVFLGVERDDGETETARLIERVLGYRVFPDDTGRKLSKSLGDQSLAALRDEGVTPDMIREQFGF